MINTKDSYEIQIQNNNIPPLTNEQLEAGYFLFNKSTFLHWRGLLDQWIKNIKRFCLETDVKDNPYKGNEMCNIGLLEAAAWMSGGIAKSEQRIPFINKKWGRLDLWMKLPDYEKIELIEAKHTTRLDLPKRNGEPDKYDYNFLKQGLEKRAKEDIKYDPNKERVVVLLFLAFYSKDIKLFCGINNPKDKIRHILKKDYIRKDWHLTAWCFPNKMIDDDFPGIIMSVKSIEKEY